MRRSQDAKIGHLKSLSIFSQASTEQLLAVAAITDEVDVRDGSVLVRQGEFGNEFMVIEDGMAEVTIDGQTVAGLGRGDLFGELCLLDGGKCEATVTSLTEMTLLVVGRRAFLSVLENSPGLSDAIVKALVRRIRDLQCLYSH
jgi:CRP/FNR family transcriptional regulator, cyclic AMP receptor protein